MTKAPGEQAAREKSQWRSMRWYFIALLLVVYDLFCIHIAHFAALWVRYDMQFTRIPTEYIGLYVRSISVYSVCCIGIFYFAKMYRSIWKYAGMIEAARTVFASMFTTVLYYLVMKLFVGRLPISYYLLGGVLQFLMLLFIRVVYRMYSYQRQGQKRTDETGGRVMIIGAGSAGLLLHQDMKMAKEITDRVVCMIDDDPNKWGRYLDGVPIVGGREDILAAAERYHVTKIYVAIPSASVEDKREILNICSETNCEMKMLPGMYQLVLGQVTVSNMKEVSVEDLLGREPIKADMREVFDFIFDKVVLVTGGGGSIGSELCRQVAAHKPRLLIIFDVYENNAYDIQLELREKYPGLKLEVLIGSVRDSRRIYDVFKHYRPQIVYHAAAHKHVPLMEDSPNEAIKNNALGTYKTAYAAMMNGCERFVLISTDKAVNPTNIMGASKRLCEMIIQSFDEKIKQGRAADIPQLFTHKGFENADKRGDGKIFENVKTEFVAVRFGNVLGSNGSVIPIFKKQIAKGGPVTVTHPDIIRYFMTIPEAVSLVMLAGTYAHGGEIFVLDMGSPVKIDTLARNLIRLSGFKPDVDIKIEYSGLRPGEKLYEEKLMAEEGLKKTQNAMIHIGCPIPFDVDQFLRQLEKLMRVSYANNEKIRDFVEEIVTTYKPEKGGADAEKDAAYEALAVGEDN